GQLLFPLVIVGPSRVPLVVSSSKGASVIHGGDTVAVPAEDCATAYRRFRSDHPNCNPENPVVFGLLGGPTLEELAIVRETNLIPRRVATPLPYYGYVIDRCDDEPYSMQRLLYAPGPVVGNDFAPIDASNPSAGMQSKIETYVGDAMIGYKVSEGDAVGGYRLEVLVDGSEIADIGFTIVDDAN
ncbi:MAG: hypothetical protein J0M16_01945, partial [Gammaproteobacteria bacterium]|nr:hypothetical protein [Gammaproteobacteria bacterium]